MILLGQIRRLGNVAFALQQWRFFAIFRADWAGVSIPLARELYEARDGVAGGDIAGFLLRRVSRWSDGGVIGDKSVFRMTVGVVGVLVLFSGVCTEGDPCTSKLLCEVGVGVGVLAAS